MKNAGYVIAKNKALGEFFTSSSAYDRPKWVPITEATVYPTAELADLASKKLYKSSGAYEARMVSVVEARGRDMSYQEPAFPDDDGSGDMDVDGVSSEEKQMVANIQGDDPSFDPEADDEMGLADEEDPDDADLENTIDVKLGNASDAEFEDDGTVGMAGEEDPVDAPDVGFDEDEDDESDYYVRGGEPNRYEALPHPSEYQTRIGESTTMPKKPALDAKPSENKTTANTMKATPVIDYKDPSRKADKPDTDLTKSGAEPHEDSVKVPASIKSELKAVIAEFDKTAKFANTRNDTKASFCMTVVEAFQELLDYLNVGTVESIKLAQIHMAGLMNPISSHLPPTVVKFILAGGRKPSLKDLFDSKHTTTKGL